MTEHTAAPTDMTALPAKAHGSHLGSRFALCVLWVLTDRIQWCVSTIVISYRRAALP